MSNSVRRLALAKKVAWSRQPDVAILVENVVDPHNFGALLRSCDAVGVPSAIVLQREESLRDKVFKLGKRSSMGARKWIDCLLFNDWSYCQSFLTKNYKTILAAVPSPDAVPLYEIDFTQPCVVIFGSEHQGISADLLDASHRQFYIPQVGMAQSLNLSVACAVTLYELKRQRLSCGMYSENFEPFAPLRKNLEERYVALAKSRDYLKALAPIEWYTR